MLASNFSIRFKEIIMADSVSDYDIMIFQSGPADPMAVDPANIMITETNGNNLGLMWGYKLSATDLTSLDTVPACPAPEPDTM